MNSKNSAKVRSELKKDRDLFLANQAAELEHMGIPDLSLEEIRALRMEMERDNKLVQEVRKRMHLQLG